MAKGEIKFTNKKTGRSFTLKRKAEPVRPTGRRKYA